MGSGPFLLSFSFYFNFMIKVLSFFFLFFEKSSVKASTHCTDRKHPVIHQFDETLMKTIFYVFKLNLCTNVTFAIYVKSRKCMQIVCIIIIAIAATIFFK